jgi:hypothetical protein
MRRASSSRYAVSQSAQLKRCRAVVESELYKAIEMATRKGWKPAEVAMALADAADDLIYTLASGAKHPEPSLAATQISSSLATRGEAASA